MKGEIFWLVIMLIFCIMSDSEPIKIFLASVATLLYFVPQWIEYGVKCYFDKLEDMK